MKKKLRKAGILLVIFLAGVIGSSLLMNRQTTENIEDMDSAVLPTVMVQMGDNYTNRMYGYKQEMQADFMRDSITPIDTSRNLTLAINPYDTNVENMAYEIRTSDGSKVIENRTIKKLTQQEQYLLADITLDCEMLMNQEYSMKITLNTSEGEFYYYTRVIQRSRLNTERYVAFAVNFYETCMNKANASDLSQYIEPDEKATDSTFTDVNINSSLDAISWGSLNPVMYKRAIPIIKDINETTGSILLEYEIAATNEDGTQEIYQVQDFYRMKYTQARVMLLDFQRTTTQVFDANLPVVSTQGLRIGVAKKDIQYVTNEAADIVAFVQAGDLWSYNKQADKITKIFSFRGGEKADERTENTAHDIKIVRVNSNGDIDFVVYGYMNRGFNEGYVGICVYHYSSDQNAIVEKTFIPSSESYEFLDKDLERLSYVSEDNQLFLLIAGKLYQVDIEEQTYEVLKEGINPTCFVTSTTNGHAAWMEQMDLYGSTQVTVINFETGATRTIEAGEGNVIRAQGFMNEDLVYGIGTPDHVIRYTNGSTIFGMDTLRIETFSGEVIKEYHQDGEYITNVTIGASLMEMELSTLANNIYTAVSKDNIMNNQKAADEKVTVNLPVTDRQKTMVSLVFGTTIKSSDPLIMYAKQQVPEKKDIIQIEDTNPTEDLYYTYARGGLQGIYTSPGQAIVEADAQTGVVLNRAQQYIWERGNLKTKIQLNEEDIPEVIKTGTLDEETLKKELGETGTVLNLSGCTLEEVLYEVSARRPVIAKSGADTTVVIVGYDEYNTILYYPENGQTAYYGMNDSTAAFEAVGNVFYSYVENMEE